MNLNQFWGNYMNGLGINCKKIIKNHNNDDYNNHDDDYDNKDIDYDDNQDFGMIMMVKVIIMMTTITK